MLEAERSGLSWVVSDSGPLMTAVYSIQYYDDPSLLPRSSSPPLALPLPPPPGALSIMLAMTSCSCTRAAATVTTLRPLLQRRAGSAAFRAPRGLQRCPCPPFLSLLTHQSPYESALGRLGSSDPSTLPPPTHHRDELFNKLLALRTARLADLVEVGGHARDLVGH